MKILILSQYWFPENGVPQRRWSWLSKLLVEAGHEVLVLSPPAHYAREVSYRAWLKTIGAPSRKAETGPSGERIVRSGYLPAGRSLTSRAINQGAVALGMLWAGLQGKGGVRGFCPDLVIGTVPAIPTAIVTPIIARQLGSPYVIDLRDAWPDLLVERNQWNAGTGSMSLRERILSHGPIQLVSKLVEKMMYGSFRSAAGIIVTSKVLEEHLAQRSQFRGNPPVTVTIRNVFPPKTSYQAGDKGDRDPHTLNVLYAGTLGRAQKLSNALDAVKLAKDKGVDVHLRLVGAGAAREELQRKIDQEDIAAEICNRVPAEELYGHYDWADTALVHLTDWEALDRAIPSKAYELMSVGIHITGVLSGEAAQLVTRLDGGDVVPPEEPEALASLWVDLARDRSRLAIDAKGQEWVRDQRDKQTPGELFKFLEQIRDNQ